MQATEHTLATLLDADRRKREQQEESRRIFTDQERQRAEHQARRERVLAVACNPIRAASVRFTPS